MIDIVRATDKDAELLAVLNRAIQAPHAVMVPNHFKQDVDEEEVADFFREALSDNNKRIGIAMLDDEAVGYVLMEQVERPESAFAWGGRRLKVHHLVVVERAQRRGVGTVLMRWAENYARDAGINRVVLDHMALNDGARQFYEQLHYAAVSVACAKDL